MNSNLMWFLIGLFAPAFLILGLIAAIAFLLVTLAFIGNMLDKIIGWNRKRKHDKYRG